MRGFVAEDTTVNALLPAVVDELAPRENGVASLGAQDDFFAGADELFSRAAICVSVA